jgi:hypothetical protein
VAARREWSPGHGHFDEADAIEPALERTIQGKRVTYDFARPMEGASVLRTGERDWIDSIAVRERGLMRHFLALAVIVVIAACGGSPGGSTTPTVPVATSTPTPAPTPSVNPYASSCGTPLPRIEDLYGFGVKVQLEPTKNKKILNGSPLVYNPQYCEAASLPGLFCHTRREEDPQRVSCDHYVSGMSETGRPGPNWYEEVDGRLLRCGGLGVPAEAPDCRLKEENQYLLDVFAPAKYKACGGTGSNGSCGVCILSPDVWGVIHSSPAGLCGNE